MPLLFRFFHLNLETKDEPRRKSVCDFWSFATLDTSNESSNILVFQISGRISFRTDVAFVSGTSLKDSRLKERLSNLTDYKCLILYETSL
ncbi:hypothetical protein CsSME_00044798 [Camellia sinensis var. sinensis]